MKSILYTCALPESPGAPVFLKRYTTDSRKWHTKSDVPLSRCKLSQNGRDRLVGVWTKVEKVENDDTSQSDPNPTMTLQSLQPSKD